RFTSEWLSSVNLRRDKITSESSHADRNSHTGSSKSVSFRTAAGGRRRIYCPLRREGIEAAQATNHGTRWHLARGRARRNLLPAWTERSGEINDCRSSHYPCSRHRRPGVDRRA